METLLRSLGNVTAIIGAQWGDEGKGKVTDILGGHFDVIARACGGANAGHTIVVGGKKHVFHLLPAGCLHEGKPVVLGAGMVLHLPTLLQELGTLRDAGIDLLPRLRIAGGAHILFEYHKSIDGAQEDARGSGGIGTTRRGIGPAYTEKASRSGVRMEHLSTDLRPHLQERAEFARRAYGIELDIERELSELATAEALLRNNIVPSVGQLMHEYRSQGKSILIEGAQATLLDIDHGTYPFVTSSSTTAAGALQGLGMPPSSLRSCIGVAKAYCTRVGRGDFPAEDTGARGERLRTRGREYGSTTGRPRRCGWLSIPDLRFSAMINGLTALNVTKLDVLDEEEEIPVLIERRPDGSPQFEKLPGWQSKTAGIRTWSDLPPNAQRYIEFIEEKSGVPIVMIGTGQAREDVVLKG